MKAMIVSKRVAFICGLALILLGIGSFIPNKKEGSQSKISLTRPPFLEVVNAQTTDIDQAVQNILTEEAGITAYTQSPSEIILNTVKPAFSTIELETSSYIIGSVDMPNYPGIYDPHVYVHTDGWIAAYYFRGDPVSKIVDSRASTLTTNLLQKAILAVSGTGGVPISDVLYYDFRYPNATTIMFIAEDSGDGNYFSITTPSTYQFFERSWSALKVNYMDSSEFLIFDGIYLGKTSYLFKDEYSAYGYISPSLFINDIKHDLSVNKYGVVVLIYSVP